MIALFVWWMVKKENESTLIIARNLCNRNCGIPAGTAECSGLKSWIVQYTG
ncbi:MAG: hypothetical protein ACLTDX_24055 [[Clostridium] innocuum]